MSESTQKPAKKPSAKPAASKSPRRRAREFALQGLYQWRIGGADEAAIEAHVHDIAGFDKADRNFFLALLRGVLQQR
jgi:N utilization substance protein B